MAAHILSPTASLVSYLGSTQLHPTYAPFPLTACIHAARVSLAYRAIVKKVGAAKAGAKEGEVGGREMGWAQNVGGFLVMAWGGSFLSHYLLGLVPAQLLSPLPFLNYVGIHLFIGALLVVIPAPAAWLLDTLFPLLDGATRAHAVIAGVEMVRNHPDGAGVRSSLFVQLLIGAISASGGGQLAGTLGTWDPSGWSLHTPPILLARNALDSLDVWAPALAAFVYGLSTFSHPSYAPLLAVLDGGKPGAILSPLGARAAATLVIAAAFGYKAVVVHWAPGSLIVGEKAKKGPRPIEARTRAQKTRKGQ